MAVPTKSLGSPGPPRKTPFGESTCGHVVGLLLIGYGVFNTFLFIKFTPVYVATECGDQTAELQKLSLGENISVGLGIQVTCWNSNAYQVEIITARPGRVWVGKDRHLTIGNLTLLKGSFLPEKGSGEIRVHMDALLSPQTSLKLMPHFMSDKEIPMFLELQFDVGVNVNFGLKSFGTTAPFKKKCGMVMAGFLVNTATRLGPMICRESFDEIDGKLPHVGEATYGSMSFSAAQMDPERVAMGEELKNVSIIGVGGLCYIFGILLTYNWLSTAMALGRVSGSPRRAYAQVGQRRRCFRGSSGNMEELEGDSKGDETAVYNWAMGLLLRLAPFGHAHSISKDVEADESARTPRPPGQNGQGNCLFGPVIAFLSCGAMGNKRKVEVDEMSSPTVPRPVDKPGVNRGAKGKPTIFQAPRKKKKSSGPGWNW